MANKDLSLNKDLALFVIAILLSPSTILCAPLSGLELKNLLTEKDQIFNSAGCKISFVITTQDNQFNDPNQGMVFRDCEATWTDQTFAMKITNHYEHPPVFASPGSRGYRPFDYDDGNLIVWRSLEKYILSATDRNDTIEKVKVFFVNPNGEILNKGGSNTLLHRFPVGSPDNMYQFNQFRLAAGRGFSKHLGTVTSVKSLTSGLMKITSQGSHGSALQGRWELTMDPNSDYLIREATLTMDGMDRPSIVTTSSGIVEKDGIKLAKYGTYRSASGFELSVEVTGISKVVGDNKLYEEVLSHLNSPLPPGSQIMDRRGEKPVRTTVK